MINLDTMSPYLFHKLSQDNPIQILDSEDQFSLIIFAMKDLPSFFFHFQDEDQEFYCSFIQLYEKLFQEDPLLPLLMIPYSQHLFIFQPMIMFDDDCSRIKVEMIYNVAKHLVPGQIKKKSQIKRFHQQLWIDVWAWLWEKNVKICNGCL